MWRIARRFLVWSVAFALVASAGTWSQCTAMQRAAAGIGAGEHEHHHAASGGGAAAGHHHGMHHEQAPAAPPAGDNGCLKCCSMCMAANTTLPALTAEAATFKASPAAFFRRHEHWSGNTIAVDPGIPKHIA
jgi:hypothetical protein